MFWINMTVLKCVLLATNIDRQTDEKTVRPKSFLSSTANFQIVSANIELHEHGWRSNRDWSIGTSSWASGRRFDFDSVGWWMTKGTKMVFTADRSVLSLVSTICINIKAAQNVFTKIQYNTLNKGQIFPKPIRISHTHLRTTLIIFVADGSTEGTQC